MKKPFILSVFLIGTGFCPREQKPLFKASDRQAGRYILQAARAQTFDLQYDLKSLLLNQPDQAPRIILNTFKKGCVFKLQAQGQPWYLNFLAAKEMFKQRAFFKQQERAALDPEDWTLLNFRFVEFGLNFLAVAFWQGLPYEFFVKALKHCGFSQIDCNVIHEQLKDINDPKSAENAITAILEYLNIKPFYSFMGTQYPSDTEEDPDSFPKTPTKSDSESSLGAPSPSSTPDRPRHKCQCIVRTDSKKIECPNCIRASHSKSEFVLSCSS